MPPVEERSPRAESPALLRLVALRALKRTCPQCGEGGIFLRYARLRPACTACGLVFRREQGAQTGSMYLTAAVTQVFAVTLIFLSWWMLDWSVATYVAVTLPIVALFCAWFLPLSQSLWVGVDYLTDAANGEDWVQPRS